VYIAKRTPPTETETQEREKAADEDEQATNTAPVDTAIQPKAAN